MQGKWLDFLSFLFKVVRMKAIKLPRFRETRQGCIRVSVCPKCEEADNWLGGTSDRLGGDFMTYEYTVPIISGGSYVAEFKENGKIVKVDTYSVTAMKIADCSRAQSLNVGLFSGLPYDGRQDYDTENGYAEWLGAVCFRVRKRDEWDDDKLSDFCDIYVCVSGAEQEEDLQCAMCVAPEVSGFFYAESNRFVVEVPEMPDNI